MVGLDKFKEAFSQYSDNYVIIGGTACEIVMRGTAMRPRATHDVDMIVVVERMTPEFGQRFCDFISEGGYSPEKYKVPDKGHSKYQLYRFVNGRVGYPEMIELLSRHPDVLGEPRGLVIEPIPIDDDVSSLSAIIMDDDLYNFTVGHSIVTDEIRHADALALIALKACAYLNLLKDKNDGRHVNSKDIKKHRSDVLKNVVILEETEVYAPAKVVDVVQEFISSLRNDWTQLASPLARALDSDENFVSGLLDILETIFVAEES
jgi:hypothetical protein